MKKIVIALAFLLCGTYLNAQEDESFPKNQDEFKTIFGGKKIGGYGGLGLGYSVIDDRSAFMLNASGAILLNHWLGIGLAGAGFINDYKYNIALNKNVSLVGGYGGLMLEPIVFPKSVVHVSFPLLVGVGGAAYATFEDNTDEAGQENNVEDTETFFVIEPGINVEFNLFKFMRTAFFVSYRYTDDLDWLHTPSDALYGFSGGLVFKFGKF